MSRWGPCFGSSRTFLFQSLNSSSPSVFICSLACYNRAITPKLLIERKKEKNILHLKIGISEQLYRYERNPNCIHEFYSDPLSSSGVYKKNRNEQKHLHIMNTSSVQFVWLNPVNCWSPTAPSSLIGQRVQVLWYYCVCAFCLQCLKQFADACANEGCSHMSARRARSSNARSH